jgi:hypothetical protein
MTRGSRTRWFHLVALAAAVVSIVFVATGASLWHQDRPGSEATCSICHLAHLAPPLCIATGALTGPVLIDWKPPDETQVIHASPDVLEASPRAPPVQWLLTR